MVMPVGCFSPLGLTVPGLSALTAVAGLTVTLTSLGLSRVSSLMVTVISPVVPFFGVRWTVPLSSTVASTLSPLASVASTVVLPVVLLMVMPVGCFSPSGLTLTVSSTVTVVAFVTVTGMSNAGDTEPSGNLIWIGIWCGSSLISFSLPLGLATISSSPVLDLSIWTQSRLFTPVSGSSTSLTKNSASSMVAVWLFASKSVGTLVRPSLTTLV